MFCFLFHCRNSVSGRCTESWLFFFLSPSPSFALIFLHSLFFSSATFILILSFLFLKKFFFFSLFDSSHKTEFKQTLKLCGKSAASVSNGFWHCYIFRKIQKDKKKLYFDESGREWGKKEKIEQLIKRKNGRKKKRERKKREGRKLRDRTYYKVANFMSLEAAPIALHQ